MKTHFPTEPDVHALADEVTCLKNLVTHMLKAIGQADAGKILIKMQREVAQMEDEKQAETYTNILEQIKTGYRQ
ncbi:DUF2594 family protein [Providencia vermicola]|uniref:DUF2594 family protein n=1 Tax=Providencia TaxID=586 RepID=UPI00197D055C|nr:MULTISPECIES: DUF2594 family protein [Providencia]HEC8329302.1 DUF2594 family protein [Providencia rettgeri]MBN4866640.1 DUF2594 family protein [Providencia stuartii]MBN4876088.1 DUF2594 family protein [Providencia stuartii]MBN4880654.1 DUF2594 family protein [Providencia stuartii]MBN4885288.1 DUF2594 family protein [Providencia stuartii]